MNNKPTIAIVDAFSTGKYLAPRFMEKGYQCIHIQSMPVIPPIFESSYYKNNFSHNYVYGKQTIDEVSKYNIKAVIAGCETGVIVADIISEQINVLTNGSIFSAAKRDKHEMLEALSKKGIKVAKHHKSSEIEDALDWIKNNTGYPVVVKPVSSAGAEDVIFCHCDNDVIKTFKKIKSKKNILTEDNTEIILQELLRGQEYIVNTVSYNGVSRVSDILKCTKVKIENAGMQSALEELMPFEGPEQNELIKYSLSVINGLGIQYGPCHIELIYTNEGVQLIEIAARLQGAVNPEAIKKCTNTSHVDLTVTAYTEPKLFLSDVYESYPFRSNLFRILMTAHEGGVVRGFPGIEKIKSLKTFHDMDFHLNIGDRIEKTTNFTICPGVIHLVHKDYDLLKMDYEFIRELERNGLYEIS